MARVTHGHSSTFVGCIGRSSRTRCNACVLERIKLRREKYWQIIFGPVEAENWRNCEAPEVYFMIDAIAMQDPWMRFLYLTTYIFQKIAIGSILLWFMDVPQQHPSREFLKDDDLDYKSAFFCKMCIAVEDDSVPFFMSFRCSYPFPHMVISLLEFHNNEKWHHILRYTGQHFSWLARVSRMKVSSAVWSTG